MTNQTIPAGLTPGEAKKAREWALRALNKPGASTTEEKAAARVVIATVPEPRPTLADMTEQEQRDAVGAWARVVIGKGEYAGIIDRTPEQGRLVLLQPGAGAATWADADKVTPLPELGRAYNPDGTPTDRTRPGVPAHRLQELLDSVARYPTDDDPVRALGALMSELTRLIRGALA